MSGPENSTDFIEVDLFQQTYRLQNMKKPVKPPNRLGPWFLKAQLLIN